MDLGRLIQYLGYLIGPIVIVAFLALLIHCILTIHHNSQRRFFRLDSILSITPYRQRLIPSNPDNPV